MKTLILHITDFEYQHLTALAAADGLPPDVWLRTRVPHILEEHTVASREDVAEHVIRESAQTPPPAVAAPSRVAPSETARAKADAVLNGEIGPPDRYYGDLETISWQVWRMMAHAPDEWYTVQALGSLLDVPAGSVYSALSRMQGADGVPPLLDSKKVGRGNRYRLSLPARNWINKRWEQVQSLSLPTNRED